MLCFLKTFFLYKREEDKTFGKRIHEIAFRDESPNEPIVNAKVEPRRSQRSRISKSFGPYFITYVIEGKSCTKSMFWNQAIKVYVLWLPRYFRYSIEAKWVESTGTESDKSFTGLFTCVLKFLLCFKESKEKKTKNEKRRVRWNTKKWETLKKMVFVILVYISKTKLERERKPMATNY